MAVSAFKEADVAVSLAPEHTFKQIVINKYIVHVVQLVSERSK